jgi:hypothetical protein
MEDNIRIDLREIYYDVVDWMRLAQIRAQGRAFLKAVMKLRLP